MQIVTSAVRVFVHEMALDVLGLSPCASRRKTLGRSAPLDAEMLGRPSLPGLFRQQHVPLLGVGALCGIAVVSPRKARFDGGAEEEKEFVALLPVVRLVRLQPGQHCNVFVETSLSIGHRVSAERKN